MNSTLQPDAFPNPLLSCSSLLIAQNPAQFSHFVFNHFHTLSFSVCGKSFTCHSYENNRGVYQQFPFWFALLSALSLFFALFAQRVMRYRSISMDFRTLFKNSRVYGIFGFFQLSTLNFRMGESHS